MSKVIVIPLACFLVILVALIYPPKASAESLEGTIVSRSGVPVAGLTVQIVHPVFGRRVDAITDSSGRFRFIQIPETDLPYSLEVYWGSDLVYWQPASIQGDAVIIQPIRLP